MTSLRHPVVVGVDGSAGSDAAVRWAAEEARRRDLPLRVVHAYRSALSYGPLLSPAPDQDLAALRAAAEELAGQAAELAGGVAPGVPVAGFAVSGPPVPELLAEAAGASLLVLGSRRLHAVGAFLIGSVGTAVAARAACPVVVIRGPAGAGPRRDRVVAGVDGGESSQPVLGYAFEHAARYGLRLQAVLCWPPPRYRPAGWPREALADGRAQARVWLAEALAGWREKYPEVPVVAEVAVASPAPGLVEAADGSHLLVVGTRGRHGLTSAVLGSVSQGVLHHAGCPVAVVPTHRR